MNSWPWRGDCRDRLDEKRQCLGLPTALRYSQRTQRPERTGGHGVRGGSAQWRFFIFVNRRRTLMVQPPRQIGSPAGRAGDRCKPEGIQCISVCHRSPRQPSVVHERATVRGLSNRRLLGGKKGD